MRIEGFIYKYINKLLYVNCKSNVFTTREAKNLILKRCLGLIYIYSFVAHVSPLCQIFKLFSRFMRVLCNLGCYKHK